MPRLIPKRTTWDELRVGDRFSLRRRSAKDRPVGPEYTGFIMEKGSNGNLKVLMDTLNGGSRVLKEGKKWVEQGWIRKDPRPL